MVKLALYKKPGRLGDKLIRWRTASPYSHCELQVGGICYTSSPRDGGVRWRSIDLSSGWDVIDLPWVDERRVIELMVHTSGDRYDWVGAIVGRGLDVNVGSEKRWFCSEWCAAAIGFDDPWRFTPASLAAAARALSSATVK